VSLGKGSADFAEEWLDHRGGQCLAHAAYLDLVKRSIAVVAGRSH